MTSGTSQSRIPSGKTSWTCYLPLRFNILLPTDPAGLHLSQAGPEVGVGLGRDLSRLSSHWSSSYITALSLVESFTVMKYFLRVATSAKGISYLAFCWF